MTAAGQAEHAPTDGPVTRHASDAAAGEVFEPRHRPPRLALRFAVYTALGLAFAAATILLFVRSYATQQAENAVKHHARFLTSVALSDRLRESDFAAPVSPRRRGELDRTFRTRVLLDGAVQAMLVGPDGKVTYASEHGAIGGIAQDGARIRRTLQGVSLRSAVGDVDVGRGESRKVLKVFVPVRFRRSSAAGAFVLYQDYAPIAKAARHAFLPIAGVLELVLVALYVSLFPILRRVTESMRRQMQEIEHQALHDGLTGLPNRRLFRDRIEQALIRARRDGTGVAVLLIDLDRFKEINDTLGHQTGDVVLQQLGNRLRGLLRETDTFARLGGDEFGIVLPLEGDPSLADVVQRIRAALDDPLSVQELSLGIEASIGGALFPEDGQDMETLVKHADVAMYAAKESRTGFELYEARRDENDTSRLSLASELRGAIDGEDLVLHFQPKVRVDTGTVESVEALVRWEHPEHGLLAPGRFIPIAEQTGLVKPLTLRVLESALRECSAWCSAGVDLRVAVNLDMRNLLDLRFPDEVRDLLERFGLDPGRLELEITEGTIMADPARVSEVAGRLSRMGVQLAIDDLGTGYSSLAYLHSLPIDEIKIDKSFVMNMEDRSRSMIVRSLIELGRALDLRVVAEGVETKQAWEELRAHGCEYAQGFYLGRPVAADRVLDLIPAGAGSQAA